MVIGTLLFSLLRCWFMIIGQILTLNILNIVKILFLWFFLAFSTSYLFFLLCHKRNMALIRKDIAAELARSMVLGLLFSTLTMALYECIIRWMSKSAFFDIHHAMLVHGSLVSLSNPIFYNTLSFIIVTLSALFAHHYVSPLLNCEQHHKVADRYGFCLLAISLVCWVFLWLIIA